MENVTFIEIENPDKVTIEHALIGHLDGSFTSMPKSEYDRRQAEQSTPIVIDEAKTK
jgi:hypothetical protein